MRKILAIGIVLFASSPLIACGDDGGTPTTQSTGSGTGSQTDGRGESGTTQDPGETAAEGSSSGEQPTGGVEPTRGTESGSTTAEQPGDGSGIHCVNPGSEIVSSQLGPNLRETITLAGTGDVGDLDVDLKISGVKWTVYLQITLSHAGTTIDLLNGRCQDNADVDVTLDDEGAALACCHEFSCTGDPLVGSFQADQALAAFDGLPIEGDWTLEIDAPSWEPEAGSWGVVDQLCLHIVLP